MTKRATGSFYTPIPISDFIIKRIFEKHQGEKLNIFEPSAGDGVFIRSLYKSDSIRRRVSHTIAVELNSAECDKLRALNNPEALVVECADFLKYQSQLAAHKFDIVFGNPPYIKKNLMSADQIMACQEIHASFPELSKSAIKNIWSAFLVRSISLLSENGILAFVLPAELLQVNFTEELRKLLTKEFKRVEIFTFNELLFKECKGQDTLILIAEKNSNVPGLFFHNVMSLNELECQEFGFITKDSSEKSKWTTHCLTQVEIALLERLKSGVKTIDQYCKSKAGIVTGANEYFILSQQDIEKYSLHQHTKPIIKKGAFVTSNIRFNANDYTRLVNNETPCFLIDLNGVTLHKKSKIHTYLQYGESKKIHQRYKTGLRKNWYEIPNISSSGQALFFKRCHEVPKFIINEANVLTTDSAYVVNPHEDIDTKSLVLSFYNSLTLVFAELYGRFYGGGVLELTPNEFKKLPLPYLKFSEEHFSIYLKLFQSDKEFNSNIREIDNFVLRKVIPNITDEEISTLEKIRSKLIARRKRL